MVHNLIFNIRLILKQTNSNILFLYRNKIFLGFNLFLMFLAISIPIMFIPIIFGFVVIIQLATLIPIGICFAALSYNWRKSTLYKNMMIGKNNKYNQNISVLFTMYILCIILTIIIMLLIFISSQLEILLTGWMTSESSGENYHTNFNLKNFGWGMLFYTQSVNVVWMFSYCFFFQRIIKTEKTFYTSILILTFLLFIFGGTFNDYFDGVWKGLLENPETWIPIWTITIFPQSFFVVSLFMPFFATAQVIAGGVNNFYMDDYTTWIWYTKDLSLSVIDAGLVNNGNSMTEGWAAWKWNILWFTPYIHIAFFTSAGIMFSKIKKNV